MNYIQHKNIIHVFTCNFNKSHILFFAVIIAVFLLNSDAVAGTTGTEFKPVHDKILNWIQGYAGKSIRTHKGRYSEMLIVPSDQQSGFVARLPLDPYSVCLYSSDAKDVAAIEKLQRDKGVSLAEAVEIFSKEKRKQL